MIEQYQKRLTKLLASYNHAKEQVRDEKILLSAAEARVQHIEQAQQVIQHVAQAVQQQAHKAIAGVVSKCLEAVFDEPYVFQIKFERKRGKTEAHLLFLRDGHIIDPMEGAGGGVIDVAAFALRLACLMLSRPRARRVLIADEPFRFVSNEYRDRVRAMLEMLAKEMEIQFVLVTHIEELQTGAVIDLGDKA